MQKSTGMHVLAGIAKIVSKTVKNIFATPIQRFRSTIVVVLSFGFVNSRIGVVYSLQATTVVYLIQVDFPSWRQILLRLR